jgi:type III restriction enzyme
MSVSAALPITYRVPSLLSIWPRQDVAANRDEEMRDTSNRHYSSVVALYRGASTQPHLRAFSHSLDRWETSSERCHINWVVLDSDWEAEFCRVAESHPKVRAYVKNHNLGLEVPYRYGSQRRKYLPDFIVLVDDSLSR